MLTLVIGDKNLSSWSMRPWLALKHSGLSFKEKKIFLDKPNSKKEILKVSPSGKVPALIDGKTIVWDSLAICEYIAELAPSVNLLPEDARVRAVARSYISEMHSGFQSLRSQMSMDIQLKIKMNHLTSQTIADIERIVELWKSALRNSGGPYLFGQFTIADAFYAPVVMRFHSYGVTLKDRHCKKYVRQMLDNKHIKEWVTEAKKEKSVRLIF